MKNKVLATAVLAGTTVFLYQLAGVVRKINDWSVIWNPPTVADLLIAVVFALIAVGAALGINLKEFLGGAPANEATSIAIVPGKPTDQ